MGRPRHITALLDWASFLQREDRLDREALFAVGNRLINLGKGVESVSAILRQKPSNTEKVSTELVVRATVPLLYLGPAALAEVVQRKLLTLR